MTPSVPLDIPTQSPSLDTESSPLLNHLRSYPLLREAASYASTYKLVNHGKVAASQGLEILSTLNDKYMPQFKLKAYLTLLQKLIVIHLFVNLIDIYFPFLKILQWSDLTLGNIYIYLISHVRATNLYIKTVELINMVLSHLNPKLNAVTSKTTETSETKSEAEKFVKISKNILEDIKSYPTQIQSHVKNIYNDEVSKSSSPIKAIAFTSNELASEISTKLSNSLKNIKTGSGEKIVYTSKTGNAGAEIDAEEISGAITTALESAKTVEPLGV